MQLIIVESPTKARTLTRFLNGKYRVEATMGHIRDLPKSELGVDIEHDFLPKYIVPRNRQKEVTALKKSAAKADSVILATDPDREGEAIAWHVEEILRDKDTKILSKKLKKTPKINSPNISASQYPNIFSRIVFHEITGSAIKEALEHPREVDLKLVDAQQARRVLDRLVGYKLSPLLWQKLSRRWLSAGRVQSVAVRLIVEREREITKFAKEEFWTIEGQFLSQTGAYRGSSFAAHPSVPSSNIISPDSKEEMTVLEKTRRVAPEILSAQLVSKDGVRYEKTLSFDLFDGKYTTTSSAIRDQTSANSIIQDLKPPAPLRLDLTKYHGHSKSNCGVSGRK